VYKCHLLSLFMACGSCHQYCDAEIIQQMGILSALNSTAVIVAMNGLWIASHSLKTLQLEIFCNLHQYYVMDLPLESSPILTMLESSLHFTDRTFYLHQTESIAVDYLETGLSYYNWWRWQNRQSWSLSKIWLLCYYRPNYKQSCTCWTSTGIEQVKHSIHNI